MREAFAIRRRTFMRQGRPFLVYSGEIHYFRVPKAQWASRLATAKALGLNTVGCYIPWLWHEPEPGRFDFTGRTDPGRDLVGFLELLKRQGLHSFARLGPICHGELTNEGLPPWLLEAHPEIRVHRQDGSLHPHPGLVSYGHPTYRRFVERWYAHLLPIISRYTIDRGGPIILVQCDNEISMLNWVFGAPDYSPHVTAAFGRFLRRRHRSIARLNAAYGTSFNAFDAVEQPRGQIDEDGWLRCLDWARFYREYYADYFAQLARQVRRAGIRLPIVANIPQCYDYNVFGRALPGLMTSLMFREFSRTDPRVVFGGAYQLRHVTFENLHDLLLMNEACRMVSGADAPSICVELQTGVLFDRPRLQPSDVALTLGMSIGGGLQGINGYMLSAGANPPGLGARGRYHEWQAAIASTGELRPHAAAIEQAAQWLATGGDALAASQPLYNDAAFGVYAPYYMSEYASGPAAKRLEELRDSQFFDGLARLMILGGFRLPLVDLERSTLPQLAAHRVLVVFALERMDAAVQARLLAYARAGGQLVLSPLVPGLDDAAQPETLLQTALGIRAIDAAPGAVVKVGRQESYTEGRQWAFRLQGAQVLARTVAGQPCAFVRRVGRGRVMVIGFGLLHRFDYQVTMMRQLMRRIGLAPCIETDPWDVMTCARIGPGASGRRGRAHPPLFLFFCNPHEELRRVTARVRLGQRVIPVAAGNPILVPARSCRMVPLANGNPT